MLGMLGRIGGLFGGLVQNAVYVRFVLFLWGKDSPVCLIERS